MPLRMQTFDSNGPDVRIRGSAFQVHEKYLQLARDASSSGDRIIAESYLQHAEHYYRIIAAAQEQQQQQNGNDPNRRYRPEGYAGQDFRNGQPGEEGGSEGGDEFPTEEQIEGQAPRGDNYRQEGRQNDGRQHDGRQQDGRQGGEGRQNDGRNQDGRHQQDGRGNQDPAYRPQPETQFRGDRNQDRGYDRNQQDGGNHRQDRDQQYRQQPEGSDGEGGQRQRSEERPRIRTFDDRQGGEQQGAERGNGRSEEPRPKREPINPMTPAQIEFPQPVVAAPVPVEEMQAAEEAAAPVVRRGRPRRAKVEAAPEPAEG